MTSGDRVSNSLFPFPSRHWSGQSKVGMSDIQVSAKPLSANVDQRFGDSSRIWQPFSEVSAMLL